MSETQDYLPPSPPPAPPARVGHYRVLRQLGQGGMGTVYLAHDDQLDRLVALKIPDLHGNHARERFLREARAAAGLHHPNIRAVHEIGESDGVPFMAMPYIEGRALSEVLRDGKQWPVEEACDLVRKLALAVDAAHQRGVLHRDLKPGNILLDGRGEPFVTDFGLAVRTGADDARLTASGAILGTPAYMAPEQAEGDLEAVGPRTDIYALGVILYELLTGRRPFEGPPARVLGLVALGNPPAPRQFRPVLDPALEAVCLQAIARDPGSRFTSMGDFAAALAPFCDAAQTATVTAPGTSAATVAMAPPRRRWFAWVAGAVALVALTGAAFAGLIAVVLLNLPASDPQEPTLKLTVRTGPPKTSDAGKARLALDVQTPGAVVYVNGEQRAVIAAEPGEPFSATLPPGSHEIKVTREGFEPWSRTVKLERDANLHLEVRLQPIMPPVDVDRRAAVWALDLGGTVVVDTKPGFLREREKLPAEPFHLVEVHVVGLKRLSEEGLANLKGLQHLRRLDIKGASFPGDGLKHLRGLPKLRDLSLGGCELRDDMLVHLLELPVLDSLDVAMTALGDSALPVIGKMKGLKSLHLSGTKVTNDGLIHLRDLKSLTYLSVNNTKVTQAGADELRKFLPRCIIAGTQLKPG